MPATASDTPDAEVQERRASSLRETLSALAAREAPPEALATELNARLGEIDDQLDALKQALMARFDSVPFVSLRAAIPRAAETHRREVIALLEVLIGERDELLERLPRVEYLITILSTEEDAGRRNIVHDPTSLTPALENFSVDSLEPAEADAIAMELYQAATLDSESENFKEVLRALRVRKQTIGLGCLAPAVLRAVVTYNARMFNSVESLADASRESDSLLDDQSALGEVIDSLVDSNADEFVEDPVAHEELAEEEVAEEQREEDQTVSVFESDALDTVLEAVRLRLQDGTVGRRGPGERIAVILDQNSLESLESEAILAKSPTEEQDIVARTTLVGLMLRDLGPLEAPLELLEISRTHLSDDWVRELNDCFGRLIAGMVADPKAYEKSSQLSGIKTKHLLKPLKALNEATRSSSGDLLGSDVASAEMRNMARDAAMGSSATPGGVRSVRMGTKASGMGFWLGGDRSKIIAAAALVAIALGLTLSNFISVAASDVRTVKDGSLRVTSPYLESAYRNEKGRGGLMIGKIDALFVELPIEKKIDAAEEMVKNFQFQGIREAMFYDDRGMMQVHYVAGNLHRPRLGDRSTGHAPGESSVRRTLSGELLEDVQGDAADSADRVDDRWDDF